MSNETHPHADLIAEIDAFCARRGMSLTAFGKGALGDPSFYRTLQDGRELRRKTERKVREFMSSAGEAGA